MVALTQALSSYILRLILMLLLIIVNLWGDNVRKFFFADVWELIKQNRMTRAEVSHRTDEQLLMLGPIVARHAYEFLHPLVRILFQHLIKAKILDDFPEGLKEKPFLVEYRSRLASALKLTVINSVPQVFEIMNIYNQLPPESQANFNIRSMVKELWEANNLSFSMLTSEEEYTTKIDELNQMKTLDFQAKNEEALGRASLYQAQANQAFPIPPEGGSALTSRENFKCNHNNPNSH